MTYEDHDDESDVYYPIAKPRTYARFRLHYDEQGRLPAYAWPGGYPIMYMCADGGILCPACANGENGSEATEDPRQDDRSWLLVACDVYWEGPVMFCDHCNGEIESAYGDPDESDDDEGCAS